MVLPAGMREKKIGSTVGGDDDSLAVQYLLYHTNGAGV
jgi:hypothetical protein